MSCVVLVLWASHTCSYVRSSSRMYAASGKGLEYANMSVVKAAAGFGRHYWHYGNPGLYSNMR